MSKVFIISHFSLKDLTGKLEPIHFLCQTHLFTLASLLAKWVSLARLLTLISGAAKHPRPARWVGFGERLRQIGHPVTSRLECSPLAFWHLDAQDLQSLLLASRVKGTQGRKGAKPSHKGTNCLLSEDGPSEPDEDYVSYGLGVQERFVMAFLLGCLCHSLLSLQHHGLRVWTKWWPGRCPSASCCTHCCKDSGMQRICTQRRRGPCLPPALTGTPCIRSAPLSAFQDSTWSCQSLSLSWGDWPHHWRWEGVQQDWEQRLPPTASLACEPTTPPPVGDIVHNVWSVTFCAQTSSSRVACSLDSKATIVHWSPTNVMYGIT